MAFVGTKNLTTLLESSDVIFPVDKNRIKNGAYELSLGSQVFQTGAKPRAVKNLSKREKIYIDPGQFALLLTEEKVKIPKDKIAFISIKAGIKFNGLVNVSGFHVDPGFEGQLLFSVYNAGPSTIILSQGTQYFPIWFADLDNSQEYTGTHANQSEIPDDPVKALSQGDIASPNELSKRIDEVKHMKTRIDWIVLAIFGVLVGILAKSCTDSAKMKDAIDYGYDKKTLEINSDSTYKKMTADLAILNKKVDSLTKIVQARPATNNGNGKH